MKSARGPEILLTGRLIPPSARIKKGTHVMRNAIFAAAALAGLSGMALPSPAHAQGLNLQVSNVDPLTKLAPADWIYLMTHAVNAANLVGENAVYVLNATGEDLTSVTCRGYFLVGPKPYITNDTTVAAPTSLPKWTVSIMPTKGFNDYCRNGIDATGATNTFHGTLNAADKTFGSSTFIIFGKPTCQ